MRIAIDLNDVVRDYSNNFVKYYIERYNRNFDLNNFEFWTNNYMALFPFKSDRSYNNFVYNEYAFELFGKCPTTTRGLEQDLNIWTEQIIKDLDIDENIDILFVSPMEYGASICNTYFFLSKLGTKIREIFLPIDSSLIWEKCDVLITANPNLNESKPAEKIVIKIKSEYNKESKSDLMFNTLSEFIKNKENTEKLINEFIEKK